MSVCSSPDFLTSGSPMTTGDHFKSANSATDSLPISSGVTFEQECHVQKAPHAGGSSDATVAHISEELAGASYLEGAVSATVVRQRPPLHPIGPVQMVWGGAAHSCQAVGKENSSNQKSDERSMHYPGPNIESGEIPPCRDAKRKENYRNDDARQLKRRSNSTSGSICGGILKLNSNRESPSFASTSDKSFLDAISPHSVVRICCFPPLPYDF